MASSSPESSAIVRTTIVHVMITAATDGRVSSRRTRRAPPLTGAVTRRRAASPRRERSAAPLWDPATLRKRAMVSANRALWTPSLNTEPPAWTRTVTRARAGPTNAEIEITSVRRLDRTTVARRRRALAPRTPRTMNPEHRPRVCPRMHSRGRAFHKTIRAPHSTRIMSPMLLSAFRAVPRREACTETYAMVWVRVWRSTR